MNLVRIGRTIINLDNVTHIHDGGTILSVWFTASNPVTLPADSPEAAALRAIFPPDLCAEPIPAFPSEAYRELVAAGR